MREGTFSCIFKSHNRGWTHPTGIPGWYWNSNPDDRRKNYEWVLDEYRRCLDLVRKGTWEAVQIVRTS